MRNLEEFFKDIEAVCNKHQMSISHEDGHGLFIIENYHRHNIAWLKGAENRTTNIEPSYCLIAENQVLKHYPSVEHMLRDIPFKDPSYFSIWETETQVIYTIDDIIAKYSEVK